MRLDGPHKVSLAARLALGLIAAYQRWLSPHKGFVCAYRHHTGCASCSVLGARAIRRLGLWQGLGVLKQRLRRCGVAHRRHRAGRAMGHRQAQAGLCDFSCDLPGSDCGDSPLSDTLDCLDCCDCDWPRNRRRDEEQSVHIPPSRRR